MNREELYTIGDMALNIFEHSHSSPDSYQDIENKLKKEILL